MESRAHARSHQLPHLSVQHLLVCIVSAHARPATAADANHDIRSMAAWINHRLMTSNRGGGGNSGGGGSRENDVSRGQHPSRFRISLYRSRRHVIGKGHSVQFTGRNYWKSFAPLETKGTGY